MNTVNYEGQPYLSEVWQFHKLSRNNGRKIYDYAELISNEENSPHFIDYAFQVAKALNINYGPMHAELFKLDNGEPLLLEAAARVLGANIPLDLIKKCTNRSQVHMTTLVYAQPKKFIKLVEKPSRLHYHLYIVFLISNVSGTLKRINHLDKIKALPSVHSLKLRDNKIMSVTEDYETSPGLIYLRNNNKSILEEDYQYIRELEENRNMYEIIS